MGTELTRVLAALALVGALAGCSLGGGSDDESGGGTTTVAATAGSTASCRNREAPADGPSIVLPSVFAVAEWRLERENVRDALGCLKLDGRPVEGARMKVNNYVVPGATDANGGFFYPVDVTLPRRQVVRVADASAAEVEREPLASEDREALLDAVGSLTVRFKLSDLEAERVADGIRVSGRASYDDGTPPPPVVLFAYQLEGRVKGPDGEPVEGARISTRTLEGESWSLSGLSDRSGRYTSFFYPSSPQAEDVGFVVRVSVGDDTYELPGGEIVFFDELKSAVMDIDLPPEGFPMALPTPRSRPGAVYEGLLVGVAANGKPVKPVSARWTDERGHFEFVVPASLAGEEVAFWESGLYAFSEIPARPGAPVDLEHWPRAFPEDAPRDLERITLPG